MRHPFRFLFLWTHPPKNRKVIESVDSESPFLLFGRSQKRIFLPEQTAELD
jgi:hypothetical protein